ncbi:MAG: hypothetical protein LBI39_03425 [Puniceicoccales bacterium]|nr:hypothetical protein [Puniceicoccales bacterium]
MDDRKKDAEWEKVMSLRATRAAKQLAKNIAKSVKKGFGDGDGAIGKLREFQRAADDIGGLYSGEVSLKMGKLVLRKGHELTDALAKIRNEAVFFP